MGTSLEISIIFFTAERSFKVGKSVWQTIVQNLFVALYIVQIQVNFVNIIFQFYYVWIIFLYFKHFF